MSLHQELTRFDIKCILRKKAGKSINILHDNYYAWSFEMIMQKMQNTHLEIDFSIVNFEIFFYAKTSKNTFYFPHPLVEYKHLLYGLACSEEGTFSIT